MRTSKKTKGQVRKEVGFVDWACGVAMDTLRTGMDVIPGL